MQQACVRRLKHCWITLANRPCIRPDCAPLAAWVHLAAVAQMQGASLRCLVLLVLAATETHVQALQALPVSTLNAGWASVHAHLHIFLLPGRQGHAAPHAQLPLCSPVRVLLPQGMHIAQFSFPCTLQQHCRLACG